MSSIHYQHGFKVKPRSAASITNLANELRHAFGITGYCPIVDILEFGWGKFSIKSMSFMGGNLGLTQSDGVIILREDVYEGACEGNGFHRFTVAHEIGHVIMHSDQIGFARAFHKENDKVYCNSEWQANEFAGSLLVPNKEVQNLQQISVEKLAEKYGVSNECAELRLKKIRGY